MTWTAGIDMGSTYTKAIIVDETGTIVGRAMEPTGFRLAEIAATVRDRAVSEAGLRPADLAYTVATGSGRHQAVGADVRVTDLTSAARGAAFLFPGTRTILDVGGQTMKATRLGDAGKVDSFRLNDKCAAGTGAFLEKTARYMGYEIEEIGPLVSTSKEAAPISGVCAVFAESEVINHLSNGVAPADIMFGAVVSLVGRSVQLMKRVNMVPEFTLIGGIMRFETMTRTVREAVRAEVNVPAADMVQYVSALGAALLGQRRLARLMAERAAQEPGAGDRGNHVTA